MTEPSESAKTTAIETDTPSTEDKNIKDANAANNVENAEKTESTTHTGRGKAIAIAAVVLILIAGVGGYAYWTHFEAAAYHDSVVTAETADTKLTKTIDKATAVTYKADQLKEPKLLDQLDNAIKKAKGLRGVPDAQPNEWMAWQLVEAKDANAKDANEADAQAKALDNALKKVVDSKLAKELESPRRSSGRVLTARTRRSRTPTGRWLTTPPAIASGRRSTRRTPSSTRRTCPTRRPTPTRRASSTPPSKR